MESPCFHRQTIWSTLKKADSHPLNSEVVTVLVDERTDAVHISYDRKASLLAPYGNKDALSVARNFDAKVEDVLKQAAA
jgi:hypothetical protein